MMGSSLAFHLKKNGFDGRVLVIEQDPTYELSSTAHTNSCIRQQFSTPLNIQISQYGARCIKDFRHYLGDDPRVPELDIWSFGYLYLAGTGNAADRLRELSEIQCREGVDTQILSPEDIAARYPFYDLDDVLLGSLNQKDEGYWDGATVFDWFKRKARDLGVEYVNETVLAIVRHAGQGTVCEVIVSSGQSIPCGTLVNCAGPRAAKVAEMAGIKLPVVPKKRYSWIFKAAEPLPCDLPLTIDPSGFHVRDNGGGTYLCGGHDALDPDVSCNDFAIDHDLWETEIWPALAARIPAFENIKLTHTWVGHYAMNTIDQNAILGPHPEIENFLFMNGFSGHGLQQAPALGQGLAEWIINGSYSTLDLTPFYFERLLSDCPIREDAVI